MAHKGKGVSKDARGPAWLNNGKKAFQVLEQLQAPFYDTFQSMEFSHGGGEADDYSEE